MSWLFEDDICWCGNSDTCEYKECFRHLSNKKYKGKSDVFTLSLLRDTEYCPLNKVGESNGSK